MTGVIIAACNNSGESKINSDSTNFQDNKDRNNRNTTVYDSASGKPDGDTASYERLPNKISDSTPQ